MSETRAELLKRIRTVFKREVPKPTRDAKCNWLRLQRPSRAFVLCIGSGPWKIGRRTTVQAKALEILGKRDLSELKASEINRMFPLAWQRIFIADAVSFAKYKTKQNSFDKYFKVSAKTSDLDREELFHSFIFGAYASPSFNRIPKVISMFKRDYLCLNSFPIDRHVRKFLKENNLPLKEDDLVELMLAIKLSPRIYARALFTNKSQNPEHPPTAKDWLLKNP